MLPSAALLPPADPRPVPGYAQPEAVLIAGPPWRNRQTRSFAWLVLPATSALPVPGVVLVHGGGGTASLDWARHWAARGYAAIAPDLGGSLPEGPFNQHPRHADAGPPGCGGFDQCDEPLSDQWAFHACAAVLQARTVLAARAEVDAARIGVTGNSWGGVITCLAAAAEPRFAWMAPIYGCGFLHEHSWMVGELDALGPQRRDAWVRAWDPSSHLAQVRQPGLWVNGSNDFAFPIGSWERSLRLPGTPALRSLHLRLHHADGDEIRPPEVAAFADAISRGAPPLAVPGVPQREGRQLQLPFHCEVPVVRAEALVAIDREPWARRVWNMVPAHLDGTIATALLPGGATACCLALTDARGLVVCGPVEEIA